MKKQVEEYFQERINNLVADSLAKAETVDGITVVTMTGVRLPEAVKNVAFGVRAKSPEHTVFIGATVDPAQKPLLTLMITEDLVKSGLNAGAIIRSAAKEIKGGGGGQPGFAQAGGKDAEGIARAFEAMKAAIH